MHRVDDEVADAERPNRPSYIHQMTPNIRITRSIRSALMSSARYLVSWVAVNTKTRSKNSSSVLTRTAGSVPRCAV